MAGSIRRVVTGHDQNGRAIVVSDGPAPFVHHNPLLPGWQSTDIWRTNGTPASIPATPGETTLGPRRQMPTKNATVLRINHFPPETEAIRNMSVEESRKAFAALGNEQAATFGKGGRHPRMHRTETIDYAIVLAGEIYALMDEGEVLLKPGDVLIQRGTSHAWSNRTEQPCCIAFVLIDAEPV
jgi:quercetin dioxygenase-like cupin family protein